MKVNRMVILATLSVMSLGACGSLLADDNKAQVKGMVISRTGETLIVTTKDGKVTVLLTDDTTVKDDRGLFGLRKSKLGQTVLIPGLKLKVDGTSGSDGRVTAKTITVDGDDLETAEMIQAGLHPTAEQVQQNEQTLAAHQQEIGATKQGVEQNKQDIAANQQANEAAHAQSQQNIAANKAQIEQNIKDVQDVNDRFSQLSEYDVKADVTVNFNVGSSTVSKSDMDQLKKLAATAKGLTGYIIEVKGFTDSSGSALMNDKLSQARAQRVISYLIQQCGVPVRHVIAPGAMGEYQPVASNETKAGRAENRRVEVKILVNKGVAGA